MVIENYREIKSRAKKTLSYTPWDVKKLTFVFGLVALGMGVIQVSIGALLNLCMDQSGGLGGLEMYSIFSGISTVLSMAFTVFGILWTPGILYCGLMLLRGENPWPRGLLQGVWKWKKMVIYTALLILAAFALSMAISPVITIIALPFLAKNPEFHVEMPETDAEMAEYISALSAEALPTPLVVISWVLILSVLVPILYRTRLVMPLLLDEEHIGVIEAVRCSFRLTKGSCKQLVLMDLSFWWYYLLQAAVGLLPLAAYLPVFKNWNVALVDITCSAGSMVLGLGVYMLGLMKVKTAEAAAYDHLRCERMDDLPQLPEGDVYG